MFSRLEINVLLSMNRVLDCIYKFYIRDWLENFTMKKSYFFPGIITVHREIKLKNQIKNFLAFIYTYYPSLFYHKNS